MLPQSVTSFRPLIALLFCGALLFSFSSKKEKVYPFEKWTPAELEKANTAKGITYLSEEEQQVIYYMNLARINPKLFGETYAQQYIDTSGAKGSYVISLQATLKKTKPMDVLQADSVLTSTSTDHAVDSGKKGKTGHDGMDKRRKKAAMYPYMGENCSYGKGNALGVVMQWLIDDGIASLGHRENILNGKYTHVGISIEPHKKYTTNCVADFGAAGGSGGQ